MKLPRDLDGPRLARLLAGYGYKVTRQSGSHMRLTSAQKGTQHHITIPAHKGIRLGTLREILKDAASYLERDLSGFIEELFGR